MNEPEPSVTELLQAWHRGESEAEERLLATVYVELRKLAINHLKGERTGHTLEPGALIHEAYLRLVGQDRTEYRDRQHFYALASRMMRRVLIDHARKRSRVKRGDGWVRVGLEAVRPGVAERVYEVTRVDEALTRLAAIDGRKARLVELRFFGGLTLRESATALGCSLATVQRDWKLAKAWLVDTLG